MGSVLRDVRPVPRSPGCVDRWRRPVRGGRRQTSRRARLFVVCLEQGRWINNSDFPGDKFDFELQALKRWSHDPNVRWLEEDYRARSAGPRSIRSCSTPSAAGASISGGRGCSRRTFGVAPSMASPMTGRSPTRIWSVLRAERHRFGVSGMAGDRAYPDGAPPPLPALPINKYGRRFAEGFNVLRWQWWSAPNAIASRDYRNLGACARYGTGENVCPNGSKASLTRRIGPRLNGRCARDHRWPGAGDHDRRARLATGAVYVDRHQLEHYQPASCVVLAANGVGTPRLLLLSRSARFPNGLANSSGLEGKLARRSGRWKNARARGPDHPRSARPPAWHYAEATIPRRR